MILVFLFSTNIASADSINLPCVSSPGVECPPSNGNRINPRWDNQTLTFTEQLQDPVKFLFFVIPIALIIIISFLIYFKNKKEKTLNIERIKLSIWNQLFFLIIALIGYAISVIFSTLIFDNNGYYNYYDRYNNYQIIKLISVFTYPVASILIAHYITLFLRQKVHYIITTIILIIIAVIGYFTLTGF